MAALRLDEHPLHLGLGARAVPQPRFTGDMAGSASALFITAGLGTQDRPR